MFNRIRRTNDCKAELKIGNKIKIKFNLVDMYKVKAHFWDYCDGEILTIVNDKLISLKDLCNSVKITNKKQEFIKEETFKFSTLRFEKNRNRYIVTCKRNGKRSENTFSCNKFEDALKNAKSRQRVLEHLFN
jgi:hypothetical protein